jgi:TIR domain
VARGQPAREDEHALRLVLRVHPRSWPGCRGSFGSPSGHQRLTHRHGSKGSIDVKVFISWSGEPSQSIACALRGWLPLVVQHVGPWMSKEEIGSGTRWNDQLAEALDQTDFGIVCVTASNQHQPWLMFEAGALAKRLRAGRVVPLCIDIAPAEVTGPLAAFQGRRLDKEGMSRLVQDVMAAGENPLPPEHVAELFEAVWERLKSKIDEASQRSPGPQTSQRTTREMLEELVERVRRLDRSEHQPVLPSVVMNPASPLSRQNRALLLNYILSSGDRADQVDTFLRDIGTSVRDIKSLIDQQFLGREIGQRERETGSGDGGPDVE